MAPAAQGRCRMGARRPLRQPRTRGTSQRSSAPANPEGSSSLPMIGRRLPASSSFVLAAARLRALQLDPGPRDGTNRRRQGKATTTVTLTRPPKLGHRARPPRPLDSNGPHGCDDARNLCLLSSGGHRGGLCFGPQMVSVDRAGMPAAGWIGPELRPRTPADKIWEETRRVPVGAGRSPCPGRRVRQAGAAFLSPAGPPSPCARRRSVHQPFRAGGTVRHRLATRQLTDRITLSDREILENACRPDPICAAGAAARMSWCRRDARVGARAPPHARSHPLSWMRP